MSAFGATIPGSGPVVTSVTPSYGLNTEITLVTITGSGFSGGTIHEDTNDGTPKQFQDPDDSISVYIGSTDITVFTVVSDSEITATIPSSSGSVGAQDIIITTSAGASVTSTSDQFTYFPLGPSPNYGVTTPNLLRDGAPLYQGQPPQQSCGLVQVPDGTVYFITEIHVCNTTTASATFALYKVPASGTVGDDNCIYCNIDVDPNASYPIQHTMWMLGGETLVGSQNTPGAITITVSGTVASVPSAPDAG